VKGAAVRKNSQAESPGEVQSLLDLRGFLKGMDIEGTREKEDRDRQGLKSLATEGVPSGVKKPVVP
jgi:hypothetical protein